MHDIVASKYKRFQGFQVAMLDGILRSRERLQQNLKIAFFSKSFHGVVAFSDDDAFE